MSKKTDAQVTAGILGNAMSVAATAAAPDAMIPQVLAGTVGFAAGRSIENTASRALPRSGFNRMLMTWPFNRKSRVLTRCLENKESIDYLMTSLRSAKQMNNATNTALAISQRLNSIGSDDPRTLMPFDATAIESIAFRGEIPENCVRVLAEYGTINLRTVATSVGPASWILCNSAHLQDLGIDVKLDFSFSNGLDLVSHISNSDDPDFAITTDAPYIYLSDMASAQKYRFVISVLRDENTILHSTGAKLEDIKRMWVVPKTSAFEAIQMRLDLTSNIEVHEVDFKSVGGLLSTLEKDEGVWTWSSLGAHERLSGNVEATYPVYYSHRSLVRHVRLDERPDIVHAFVTLLVALANSNITAGKGKGLIYNQAYRDAFCRGMGLNTHVR